MNNIDNYLDRSKTIDQIEQNLIDISENIKINFINNINEIVNINLTIFKRNLRNEIAKALKNLQHQSTQTFYSQVRNSIKNSGKSSASQILLDLFVNITNGSRNL